MGVFVDHVLIVLLVVISFIFGFLFGLFIRIEWKDVTNVPDEEK